MTDVLELQKQVIEKYREGLSCQKIGEQLNLDVPVVSFLLKAADIKIRKNGFGINYTTPRKVLPLEEIKRLYLEENYDILDLAIEFDVSTTTIYLRLKEMDVKIRGHISITDKLNVEEIEKLYWEDKMSCNEIGKIYDMSGQTILMYMRENNIPRRKSKNRTEKRKENK